MLHHLRGLWVIVHVFLWTQQKCSFGSSCPLLPFVVHHREGDIQAHLLQYLCVFLSPGSLDYFATLGQHNFHMQHINASSFTLYFWILAPQNWHTPCSWYLWEEQFWMQDWTSPPCGKPGPWDGEEGVEVSFLGAQTFYLQCVYFLSEKWRCESSDHEPRLASIHIPISTVQLLLLWDAGLQPLTPLAFDMPQNIYRHTRVM